MNTPSRTSVLTFIFGSLALVLSATILPTLVGVSWSESFTENTLILIIAGVTIIAIVNLVIVPELTRRQKEKENFI